MRAYIILILGLFLLTNCTKEVLEVDSSTQISSGTFWQTESDVRLAI